MKVVDARTTRGDLHNMFAKWGIEQYTIIRDQEEYASGVLKRGNGVTVRYLRKTGWQTVYCNLKDYEVNLRAVFAFLDRIRLGEKEGVAYQSLSSTKDLVTTSPADTKAEEAETLEEAYDVLGVKPTDPLDLIERVYKAKAQTYHPDQGGDNQDMRRLNAAHDLVIKSRGGK